MLIELNDQNFENIIADKLVIVDFWAPWCGPCNTLAPVIEELAKELSDISIGKVNVDDFPELASRLGVMSIPTLLFFKEGNLIDSTVGVVSKSVILKKLEQFSN
ncbi:MAG: thioredoxin [Candidatus Cloacimonetes bacterium]|nr:thioredoxin [Candidatus Cloacimonadota bacterium]